MKLLGKDRLIVALDVPTHERAFQLVDRLENVSFFKVGIELFFAGDVFAFIQKLQARRSGHGEVFIDLKLGGDIGNTIASMIRQLQSLNVKFITLTETNPPAITFASVRAIRAARAADPNPQVLMVPYLSSLDEQDLVIDGVTKKLDDFIVERGRLMIDAGCDGLIVSGQAIKACRAAFPSAALVTPGVRPAWAAPDDQKRLTTPREAIEFGSDYLVVGRPITKSDNPRVAAQLIIDEIDSALESLPGHDRPGLLSKVG